LLQFYGIFYISFDNFLFLRAINIPLLLRFASSFRGGWEKKCHEPKLGN
jgi:hypothetical protein